MDLTAQNFPHYLPWILNELSSSCFVALDFELSGIAVIPATQGPKTQTLQERYADTKAAADKYQILQVGLTICCEDVESATYTLKPYNINLSPNTERGLDMNRDWTFMSWAVDFLLANKFSLDALCKHGVPYLSRDEEYRAIENAVERCNPRAPLEAVHVKESDQESLEFLQAVRRTIDNWVAQGENRSDFFNIPPPIHLQSAPPAGSRALPTALNNMQKWLVHQLISVEYPGLKSRSKPTFVQVDRSDSEREKRAQEERLENRKARVRQHIGFRWVAEALVGGELTNLDPDAFSPLMSKVADPNFTLKELSDRVKSRLKENRPVVVGHNNFTDLVYFHRCFLGPLPDTVEEFQATMRSLFPALIDTKYLATHGCGSINPTSRLEELNQSLSSITSPKIEIDPLHSKYAYRQSNHEAGYDSMLTAMAFIKLSAQLQHGGTYRTAERTTGPIQIGLANHLPPGSRELYHNGLQKPTKINTFNNFFDLEDEGSMEIPGIRGQKCAMALADTGSAKVVRLVRNGELLPRLESEFWKVYANKLRVFGTEERVLQLGKR